MKIMQIKELVTELPEIYQPIFGYPNLSENVSRISSDRLKVIENVYKALELELKRPLRVLDLGCAQGFFSFSLASMGAEAVGLDYGAENISLCQQLASENKDFNVRFLKGTIQEFIANEDAKSFDLVLGLSVFHHIAHKHGHEYVKNLINELSESAKALLFEFALATEPVYWARSQPESPYQFLDGIAFVNEVGRFPTHLSGLQRPLFFSSNNYCYLENKVFKFDSMQTSSHALAGGVHEGARKYFFSEQYVIKVFDCKDSLADSNFNEINKEAEFLKSPPAEFPAPRFILSGTSADKAWLVMERIAGELLLDLLSGDRELALDQVLHDVLSQLTILEKSGLYHSDIRAWNILISDDSKAHIIDYGSISNTASDCVWPDNIFLSFMIFVNEIATRTVESPEPIRSASISPYGMPEPYRSWILDFWVKPLNEWSFESLLNSFKKLSHGVENKIYIDSSALWMSAVEKGLNSHKAHANSLHARLQSIDVFVKDLEAQLNLVSNNFDELSKRLDAFDTQSKAMFEESVNTIFKLENRINGIYSSTSWKVSRPIRLLKKLINAITKFIF